MSALAPDFAEYVAEARSISIEGELARRRVRLRRAGTELVGPCPACGGTDRFQVHPRKGVFLCRKSGTGGDVIALVQYLDACDFLSACETLTGRKPPRGQGGGPDTAALAAREAERAAAREARRREAEAYREAERARMWRLWTEAEPLGRDTAAARYLAGRGLVAPEGAALRACRAISYFHRAEGARHAEAIWRGPALLAAIVGPAGRFAGLHMTFIDPATHRKAEILDPATGELLPAKKVRGSMKGGHIPLARPLDGAAARRLVVGEGIETALSPAAPQAGSSADWLAGTLIWSAVSLGNLGGRAAETVPHPTETRIDKAGRRRALRVPGPIPADDPDGYPPLMPPETIDEVIILGDGDSDPFLTDMAIRRAAARWARPGRTIRSAWPSARLDLNDELMRSGA